MMAAFDRADRDADDPVGTDVRLRERLIDAPLIGSQRSAALQQQADAFEREWSSLGREVWSKLKIHRALSLMSSSCVRVAGSEKQIDELNYTV
jgi:hypothetical protein